MVNVGDMNVTLFHSINKYNGSIITDLKELSRYIDISYAYTNNKSMHKIPSRLCTQADFGTDAISKKYFKDWGTHLLLCPNLSKEDNV